MSTLQQARSHEDEGARMGLWRGQLPRGEHVRLTLSLLLLRILSCHA